MAITDSYCTAAEYRAGINKDDTADDLTILIDATAITRYMERKLDRFFNKDATAVARLFMPRSTGVASRPDWAESENPFKYGGLSRVLFIDDLVSVTTIKIDEDRDGSFADETALATTDYELTPRNAAVGPEPSPYTAIELTSWGTKHAFPPGCRVEVNGVWGWPAVPAAVKRACIHLTAVLRLETPRSSRAISDTGAILEASSEARGIIAALIRDYGRVSF